MAATTFTAAGSMLPLRLPRASAFAPPVTAASIHRDERKGEIPSDHVPVTVDLDLDGADDDDRPMIF